MQTPTSVGCAEFAATSVRISLSLTSPFSSAGHDESSHDDRRPAVPDFTREKPRNRVDLGKLDAHTGLVTGALRLIPRPCGGLTV